MTTALPPAAACLNPERAGEIAHQLAQMLAIHLEGGRWEMARVAVNNCLDRLEQEHAGQPQTVAELLDLPLAQTELCLRTVTLLEEAGILHVGELLACTKGQLREIRHVGRHVLREIFDMLHGLGLKAEFDEQAEPKVKPRRVKARQ